MCTKCPGQAEGLVMATTYVLDAQTLLWTGEVEYSMVEAEQVARDERGQLEGWD